MLNVQLVSLHYGRTRSKLNSSVFWVITRREVVWTWRFGTTYRFHLQGSRCSPSSWTSWPLKVGPMDNSEMSISNDFTPHKNPEYVRILFNRGGNIRFRNSMLPAIQDRETCALDTDGRRYGEEWLTLTVWIIKFAWKIYTNNVHTSQ